MSKTINLSIEIVEQYISLLNEGNVKNVKDALLNKLKQLHKNELRHLKKLEHQQRIKAKSKNKVIEVSKEFREDLVSKQTKYEILMKSILKELNIRYLFQHTLYYERDEKKSKLGFFIADFYLPEYSLIIEVDGEYHTSRDQKSKDKRRSKILKDNGIKDIIRITNNEVENERDYVIKKISQHKFILRIDKYT